MQNIIEAIFRGYYCSSVVSLCVSNSISKSFFFCIRECRKGFLNQGVNK